MYEMDVITYRAVPSLYRKRLFIADYVAWNSITEYYACYQAQVNRGTHPCFCNMWTNFINQTVCPHVLICRDTCAIVEYIISWGCGCLHKYDNSFIKVHEYSTKLLTRKINLQFLISQIHCLRIKLNLRWKFQFLQ